MLCLIGGFAAGWSAGPAVRRPRARSPVMQSLTKQFFDMLPEEAQTGGAGGATTYDALLRLDEGWSKLRSGQMPPVREVVFEEPDAPAETAEYDLVVCGGNIGILLATAGDQGPCGGARGGRAAGGRKTGTCSRGDGAG